MAAKKKKTTHGKHSTKPVKGARKGRRKKAARPPVVVDPAKPATAVSKTLDKAPTYGAEFKFDWTVGGCFNASCTQKHANITTAGWKEKYIVSVKVAGIPNLGAMRLALEIARRRLQLARLDHSLRPLLLGVLKATIDQTKQNSFAMAIVAPTEEENQVIIDKYFEELDRVGLAEFEKYIDDQYQAIRQKVDQTLAK